MQKTIQDFLYRFIRQAFKISVNLFYSSIIIENEEYIPKEGVPTFVCSNHPNSLTDGAVILSALYPMRKNLRITCKDTLFKMNILYYILNKMLNSVPIMRRREYGDKLDNRVAFAELIKALEKGHAVLLFPEGYSRYNSKVAPFLMGVANITSEILTMNKTNPNFKINILPLSINYMHREKFRSNVVITCHKPFELSTKENKEFFINEVKDDEQRQAPYKPAKSLTLAMEKVIKDGVLDSPKWEYIEIAHTARNLYAPLGTYITLGNYIRLTKRFLEVFAKEENDLQKKNIVVKDKDKDLDIDRYLKDVDIKTDEINKYGELDFQKINKAVDVKQLAKDLKEYQNMLDNLKIKDDRIRAQASFNQIIESIIVRTITSTLYLIAIIPLITLWLPSCITGKLFEKKTVIPGKLEDTYDEIAQKKLLSGLIIQSLQYILIITLSAYYTHSLAVVLLVIVVFPLLLKASVVILEDGISNMRSLLLNIRFLKLKYKNKKLYSEIRKKRNELYSQVEKLAYAMNLPENPLALTSKEIFDMRTNSAYVISKNNYIINDWNEVLRTKDIIKFEKDE